MNTVYKSKGKVKEYLGYDDSLIFEGEYLNGQRNGKGKEYNEHDELIFEGEYLNGQRNGKGKEYYYNGKLFFWGEYLNNYKLFGKKIDYLDSNKIYNLNYYKGEGKEYYDDGRLNFKENI